MNLIIILLVLIIISLYFYIKKKLNYWETIGAPNVKPIFPYGSVKGVGKLYHMCELMSIYYEQFKMKSSFVGLYIFLFPVVLVTDIELVKTIFIKEFNNFYRRGFYYNEKDDPLSAHLFSLDGEKWRKIRTKLTPTFTSGKLKYMFPGVQEIGKRLSVYLNGKNQIGSTFKIEMKDLWARYTTDIIGSCVFGSECNTINGKNEPFREMGRIVFETPLRSFAMQLLVTEFRDFSNKIGLKQLPTISTDFFRKVIIDTINYREKNNVTRTDFIDIVMKLKYDEINNADGLSLDEIAAQAFVFYVAGFETSSTLLSFCCYELSIHQEIQNRAREDVHNVLKRYNGEFTYEAMLEMKYLDQVLNEALRKYPPIPNITRKNDKEYKIPNTNFTIPKQTTHIISAYAIHHDENIYPNPEKFDPERFTDDKVNERDPCTFLPFGEGPRNCIGLRFGMMQSRIGLAMLLNDFKFTLNNETKHPISLSKIHMITGIEGGLWLNMEKC